DVDLALLSEAMHAPDPLLDPQGIPGQVVVHDRSRELQVPALTARLRAQEDLAVPSEGPHGGVLRRRREPAMVDDHAMPVAFEDPFQVLHRPQVLGEYEGLFVLGPEEANEMI